MEIGSSEESTSKIKQKKKVGILFYILKMYHTQLLFQIFLFHNSIFVDYLLIFLNFSNLVFTKYKNLVVPFQNWTFKHSRSPKKVISIQCAKLWNLSRNWKEVPNFLDASAHEIRLWQWRRGRRGRSSRQKEAQEIRSWNIPDKIWNRLETVQKRRQQSQGGWFLLASRFFPFKFITFKIFLVIFKISNFWIFLAINFCPETFLRLLMSLGNIQFYKPQLNLSVFFYDYSNPPSCYGWFCSKPYKVV